MPAEDVANLARQLGVDVPEHSDHANSDFEYAMEDDNDVNLNTAFVANESTLDHGMTEASSQGAAAADSSASAEDSIHDDIISQFCSITGSEPNDARYYLEVRKTIQLAIKPTAILIYCFTLIWLLNRLVDGI